MPPRARKSGASEPVTKRGGNENADASAPAKKSRSGKRKKKPVVESEALRNRNENAGAVSDRGADEEGEEVNGDLFDLLRVQGAAVLLLANEWRARYNSSDITAIAEVFSLLTKAAGCTTGVTAMEVQRSDCVTIMNRVMEDMVTGSLYGEDPLAKRSQDFKGFRENFLEFTDKLIKDTAEGEELYDGRLYASVAEIVTTCAQCKARPMRAAATMMGLQIITSLISVVNSLQSTRDLKQNQLDNETKKKNGVDAEIVKSLKRSIESAQEQIELVENYIDDMFTKVFTHRFRDTDEHIRAMCIASLGKWMYKHQLVFLTDFYLKYLGWSLNDKMPVVRLEVLSALKTLASSQSHLAMMDSFFARFRDRIAEMLRDIDHQVVVEAIRLSAVLHEHIELAPGHMKFVTTLIMDRHPSIRTAAARATKTIMPVLSETYRKERELSSDHYDAAEQELHGIAQLLIDIGDENGGYGKIIDGLFGVYGVLSEPGTLVTILKDTDMETADAVIIANILVLAMRKSMGEDVSKPFSKTAIKISAKARNAIDAAHEKITNEIGPIISEAMAKYQAEFGVIGPLVEVVHFIKLERFALNHEEEQFTALAEQIKDIFFKHSDKRVLEACSEAFNYFCNEGFEATAPFAQPILDSTIHDLASRVSKVLKHVRGLMTKGDKNLVNEDEGYAFELRMNLNRVRALISKCNISSGVHVVNELSQFISEVARSPMPAGEESVAMACSSVSFFLIWQALELMDSETTTATRVNEHLAERDAFVSNIMHILRRSTDMYPDSDNLRRSLIASICDMVLYYYNASTLPAAHPARSLQLRLSTGDSAEVWQHTSALITPDDAQKDADLDSARLAYRISMHEEKIAANGAIGADFLSNFKITGPWVDAAIRTYCNDLRRTGPQVLVRAILTALQSAYHEVLRADLGNRQLLLDAFEDLAKRLSDIFALSSRRDRFVIRILFEEAVGSILVPEPVYDQFSFLARGLVPFLPKLSAVDGKALTVVVDNALTKVDSEDARSTPLIEFSDKLAARSKGASMERQRKRAPSDPVDIRSPFKVSKTVDPVEQEDDIEDADEGEATANEHTLNDGPVEEKPTRSSRRR